MVNIIAIVQARMDSTRFPNKVLKNLPFFSSETLLSNIVNRLNEVKDINKIVIATTTKSSDDIIEKYCKKENIACFRGSEKNVLERFYKSAKYYKADIILRFTADNPVIDTCLINESLNVFQKEDKIDYFNLKNIPLGMGVEIFTFKALEKNYFNSISDFEKEHVTPYFYKTASQNFKILHFDKKENIPSLRLTVDTFEDYNFMCILFDELYLKNKFFGLKEILELKEKKPWIFEINSSVAQKKVCATLEEEINEAKNLLQKQDLNKAYKFLTENWEKI
ncbi:cytidylyltransferase domain-containing protein [Fusobacterium canifelinum]|nr:glycosyltransferase family protein [Fusobacterium canifelinum]